MEVMFDRVAGLDVGKDSVTVCVRTPGPRGRRRAETRTFKTMFGSLRVMRDWLVECGVTIAAMESTSTYWKPPFYCLEEVMEVWLLNAAHMKAVPGRKSDLLTELAAEFFGWCVRWLIGLSRFAGCDQRRGHAAGVVRAGGAAARLAGDDRRPVHAVSAARRGRRDGRGGGSVLRRVGGLRTAGDDPAVVWDGSAAMVPVLVGDRRQLGPGDPGRGA